MDEWNGEDHLQTFYIIQSTVEMDLCKKKNIQFSIYLESTFVPNSFPVIYSDQNFVWHILVGKNIFS